MVDVNELAKKLEPTHLPSPDEVAKEVEKKESAQETARADDPRSEEEYAFELNYLDARGKVWKGRFINKILNEKERRQVGIMRSMLSQGQPYEALDHATRDSCLIHAHLAVSLKDRPEWAKNLDELRDPNIVQEIYEEVFGHENWFLGYTDRQRKGKESD